MQVVGLSCCLDRGCLFDRSAAKLADLPTMGGNAEICGVGINFRPSQGRLLVFSILEGSPAADSDICIGDLLVQVNNQDVKNFSLQRLAQCLLGREGTFVTLAFHRAQGPPFTTVLRRKRLTTRPLTVTVSKSQESAPQAALPAERPLTLSAKQHVSKEEALSKGPDITRAIEPGRDKENLSTTGSTYGSNNVSRASTIAPSVSCTSEQLVASADAVGAQTQSLMRCLEELEQELDTFSVREAQESKGEGERWASSGRRRELKPEPVFYAGLQVTETAPHRVMAVNDLVDENFVPQGERGYKNQVVLRGDTIIAVDGRCAREVSIHTLHEMMRGPLHTLMDITISRDFAVEGATKNLGHPAPMYQTPAPHNAPLSHGAPPPESTDIIGNVGADIGNTKPPSSSFSTSASMPLRLFTIRVLRHRAHEFEPRT